MQYSNNIVAYNANSYIHCIYLHHSEHIIVINFMQPIEDQHKN